MNVVHVVYSGEYPYEGIFAFTLWTNSPFSCGTKCQLVSFSLDLKNYPFLCAIYLDLVSCLMEPTGKCHLSSRFHLKLISGI
jgi:hypothetical protein